MRGAATKERETFERGTEPDFSINDIARWEDAGDGMVRVYIASHRGRLDKIEYSFHCTPETLLRMAQTCETIACEFMKVRRSRKAAAKH